MTDPPYSYSLEYSTVTVLSTACTTPSGVHITGTSVLGSLTGSVSTPSSSLSDPSAPYRNISVPASGTAYGSSSAAYTPSKGTKTVASISISSRYPYSSPSSTGKSGYPTSFDSSSGIIHSSGSSVRSFPFSIGTASLKSTAPSSGFAPHSGEASHSPTYLKSDSTASALHLPSGLTVTTGGSLYTPRFPTGTGTAAASSLSDPSPSKFPHPFPNSTIKASSSIASHLSRPSVRFGTKPYATVTDPAISINSTTKPYPYTFANNTVVSGTAISSSISRSYSTGSGTISKDPSSGIGTASASAKPSTGYSYFNKTGISSYFTGNPTSSKPSRSGVSTSISSNKPSITSNSTDPASSHYYPTHGPYSLPSSLTKTGLIPPIGTKNISASVSASASSSHATATSSSTLKAITGYFPGPFGSIITDPATTTASGSSISTVISASSGTDPLTVSPTIGTAVSTFVSDPTSTIESSRFIYTPTVRSMPSEYYTHHGRKEWRHHVSCLQIAG